MVPVYLYYISLLILKTFDQRSYAAKDANKLWVLVFNKDPAYSYSPTVTINNAVLSSTTGKKIPSVYYVIILNLFLIFS